MRRAAWIASLLALGALAPASRADERFDEELQLWLRASVALVLPAGPIKLVPYLEVHPRFDDDLRAVDEVQHRVALLVQPTEGLSLGAGFMYAAIFHDDPAEDDDEFRPYQEVRYERRVLGRLRLEGRVRLEERFFEGDDDVSLRLRVRARLEVPFAELGGGPLALELWEEPFVNLNDTREQPDGFDQNRAYAGLSWRPGPGIVIAVGYMAQLTRVSGGPDELGHTIWASVDLTFR